MALLIVGLAVAGALQAVSGALRAQGEASRHAEATTLADARLSELSLLDRDALADLGRTEWRTRRLEGRVYRQRSRAARAERGQDLWRIGTVVAWDGGRIRLRSIVYRPPDGGPGGGSP